MSSGFASQYFIAILILIISCVTILVSNIYDQTMMIKNVSEATTYLSVEQNVIYHLKCLLQEGCITQGKYYTSDIVYTVIKNESNILVAIEFPIQEKINLVIHPETNEIIEWTWEREKIRIDSTNLR